MALRACAPTFIRKVIPVAEGKMEGASFRELMTGAGIAADKMLALRGRGQQPPQEDVNIFVQMNQEVKDTPGFPRK